jgi:hypothetical protein
LAVRRSLNFSQILMIGASNKGLHGLFAETHAGGTYSSTQFFAAVLKASVSLCFRASE